MIVPEELPHTLQDLWKEVTGAYKDKMVGNNEDNILFGGRGDDVLYGYSGDDVLVGGTGQDIIFGGKGNDYISGGQGWDRIDGGLGDDFINGGNGNDILKGGMGDDTYFFKKGDGMDTISDMPAANLANKDGGYDTILFDKDVKKEDITFLNIAGVLSIKYDEKNKGLISAFGHFLDDRRSIEKIELSSTGEFITKDQISKVIQDLNSYAKDNMIVLTHDNVKNNAELMNIVMSGWQTA
ncbi:calcium-binding protein [Campylobacter ureolyticus]|nr:calcium-binding protein [Campylobacter ureolyticus]